MNRTSARNSTSEVDIRELGLIDYRAAWAIQRELAEARAEDTVADTLLLLEHPATYTAGRRTEEHEKPQDGTPVIDVDRGGKITYHGPGQLVGYPIVKLADPIDVVDYVRRIEQGLIAMCDELGIEGAGRVDGRSGVWLPATDTLLERKLCAIGVRVQRGVTLHGFSINCDCDLAGFGAVVPCGITDAGVASFTEELGRTVTVAEVQPLAQRCVLAALDGTIPLSVRDIPRASAPQAPGLRMVLTNS